MARNIDDIVKEQTRPCACRKHPAWVKLRGGAILLACPDPACKLYLAVKGPGLDKAIETWNEEVKKHDTVRKRR